MQIDLLEQVECKVDRSKRLALRRQLTAAQREELCRFAGEYFDGPTGYGGYYYDGRHAPAVRAMIERYELGARSRVLDVGCAKGFMLYEFVRQGIEDVRGCDISPYAISQAHPGVKDRLDVASADRLSYPAASFDLVYSVDVIHNLLPEQCDQAIREILRVARAAAFIQVASFETEEQRQRLIGWGVTVKTLRSKRQWQETFLGLGYGGDFYFKTF